MGNIARLIAIVAIWSAAAGAQNLSEPPQQATSAPQAPSTQAGVRQPAGPGAALYLRLAGAGLDPKAIYNVRGASLDREDLHITLEDGTIGFLEAVDGHVTGAFFEGTGEVLVIPPDLAERGSLALFTGSAVLEDQFNSAYIRFNDDTVAQLQPYLQRIDDTQAFYDKWSSAAKNLGEADTLRLMASFLNQAPPAGDRMLRARVQSPKLGVYDIYYDTLAAEQISIFRFSYGEGGAAYYDVLTSFPSRSARRSEKPSEAERSLIDSLSMLNRLNVRKYTIDAEVSPPQKLSAQATLDVNVRGSGDHLLFFELSRYLNVSKVEFDGQAVEFLQNVAIEGSALARRGNDIVAVLVPQPLKAGEHFQLKFTYSGDVLSDAGNGLLYVGERGIWYPNRGLAMADYDLTFHYPAEFTLVATGKKQSQSSESDKATSHWISERLLPVAGFNLGRYHTASVTSAGVAVEGYTAPALEPGLLASATPPAPPIRPPLPPGVTTAVPEITRAPSPDPNVAAQQSARAIEYYVKEFGPFPYSSLSLTQLPGTLGQSWPGLVYLPSLAFLSREQLASTRLQPSQTLLYGEFMTPHETAHQWWGDLVGWKSYRDQWLMEALANYSAILELEKDHPDDCRAFLQHYRERLLQKNPNGEEVTSAGAVTLGQRLISSHFPNGYYAISYGRGTWLMHMLRTMMQDGATLSGHPGDDPFLRALRKMVARYSEHDVSTRDFQALLEEQLPPSLKFEDRASLDWFFDEWVNGTAIPKLQLKNIRMKTHGAVTTATATVLQGDAPEQLVTSVPIYAESKAGMKLVARVFADGSETSVSFKVPSGTKKLVLDPYRTVLDRP